MKKKDNERKLAIIIIINHLIDHHRFVRQTGEKTFFPIIKSIQSEKNNKSDSERIQNVNEKKNNGCVKMEIIIHVYNLGAKVKTGNKKQ